jgi:AcrR family transcriptional regulator
MGRKSSFDDADVFRAVASELARSGRINVERVIDATGLSMGSIYHRFGSRDRLLTETWLGAVEAFQEAFLTALAPLTTDAAIEAALATPRFCRSHPEEALVLACCRQSEFLADELQQPLRARVAAANAAIAPAMRKLSKAIDRPLLVCQLALIGYPLGAVRLFLPTRTVPRSLDDEVTRMARAVLVL